MSTEPELVVLEGESLADIENSLANNIERDGRFVQVARGELIEDRLKEAGDIITSGNMVDAVESTRVSTRRWKSKGFEGRRWGRGGIIACSRKQQINQFSSYLNPLARVK